MLFSQAKRHSGSWFVLAWGLGLGLVPLVACDSSNGGIGGDGGPQIGPDGRVIEPGDEMVLPGGYQPPSPCGFLGNTCATGKPCGPGLSCEGSVCLPDPQYAQVESCRLGGCPANAPLCLYGVCLTPEQLACVCLDTTSRENPHQCAAVRAQPSTECLAEESLCDARPDGCCEGLSCVRGPGPDGKQTLGLCLHVCANDEGCESGCCTQAPQIFGNFCADEFASCLAECRRLDEECDSDRNSCCAGLVCARSDADFGLNGCQVPCANNGECDTGCCVLFTNADGTPASNGICGPGDRCPTPR